MTTDVIYLLSHTDGQLSEETLEDSDEDTRPAKYKGTISSGDIVLLFLWV